ncbi:peptidoglycan/xylan/chitin deacetylase (PgdA/CDA1 family) [Mycoplana sp. BE70]|uniref:polysaccharide deacetylase family protein n=1 Tax=Mycoplana sp. BE70 TaxID=2817775 RepID=UPI0028621768|nr:polysaccharide deacetylase family protein [Mycoplana sp. BE70]MDR6755996.1 peptidoglycan/xylan/chitin deacetylase (PgdA/CDA1 family) [Mycoplana sp. BE70]
MYRFLVPFTCALSIAASAIAGPRLVEPRLHIGKEHGGPAHVALTFDACMGKVDMRILDVLLRERIPATIFVTARWLQHNLQAAALLRAHPDQFEIENHGAMHVPAVDHPASIYGITAAGSPQAVAREVEGGGDAIMATGAPQPHWFRGATAKYTASSITEISRLGYRIAGYSLNGDDGSLLGASAAERRIAAARDGDVVIAHINQPTHAAGAGVAKGILALKARGVRFVRLSDSEPVLPAF